MAAPDSALALVVGAAASFGIGDAVGLLSGAAEDVFVVTWLMGWVLLAWAVIFGGGYAVLLGLRSLSRRPVSLLEVALDASSLALIAAVLVTLKSGREFVTYQNLGAADKDAIRRLVPVVSGGEAPFQLGELGSFGSISVLLNTERAESFRILRRRRGDGAFDTGVPAAIHSPSSPYGSAVRSLPRP